MLSKAAPGGRARGPVAREKGGVCVHRRGVRPGAYRLVPHIAALAESAPRAIGLALAALSPSEFPSYSLVLALGPPRRSQALEAKTLPPPPLQFCAGLLSRGSPGLVLRCLGST